MCKKDLLFEADGIVASLIGEVAHIVGETTIAARGVSPLSLRERNEERNLLLLCREHHKIVDDDPSTYPVGQLHQIKSAHLAWIASSLVKPRAWRSTISQLTYINVPRLCEQAEMRGYQVDLRSYKDSQTLHSLGWSLNDVMSAFRAVLAHLTIEAVALQDVILHESIVGSAISFDRQRFRTKNVPMEMPGEVSKLRKFTGSLVKDPHIYCQLGRFKVAMLIDPRWITTSTAFTLFRPSSGQSVFSGLGRITSVDYEAGVVTVTPWVIGLPRSPLEEVREATAVSSDSVDSGTALLDSLVDMERAEKDEVYFSPSPIRCDLCRRSLSKDKYMIDGAVRDLGGWACMCAECFNKRGRKIGWGHGQLYLRSESGWLEVAGFPPLSASEDVF
jgi:hypothetical protein